MTLILLGTIWPRIYLFTKNLQDWEFKEMMALIKVVLDDEFNSESV